ncbi:MAG: glycerol kinase, partial [Clostridium sp.]|nr:glycerol kinase [Clostridium sp.]
MNQGKYLCAIDQGTTSSRCILFDQDGNACVMAQREIPLSYPKPGWVEQNPMEIWSSTEAVIKEAMLQLSISAADIRAIGITNQRETTICFDRINGEPIYPAIGWQCKRTAARIEALRAEGLE